MADLRRMANESDIVVTAAMIEAGFRVLSASGIANDYLEADRAMVAEIYRAMVRAVQQANDPGEPASWRT